MLLSNTFDEVYSLMGFDNVPVMLIVFGTCLVGFYILNMIAICSDNKNCRIIK